MTRREQFDRLDRAAAALEVVKLPLVFVGGATMPLCVDGDVGEVLRETKEIDGMVEAASCTEFAALEARLRAAG